MELDEIIARLRQLAQLRFYEQQAAHKLGKDMDADTYARDSVALWEAAERLNKPGILPPWPTKAERAAFDAYCAGLEKDGVQP